MEKKDEQFWYWRRNTEVSNQIGYHIHVCNTMGVILPCISIQVIKLSMCLKTGALYAFNLPEFANRKNDVRLTTDEQYLRRKNISVYFVSFEF